MATVCPKARSVCNKLLEAHGTVRRGFLKMFNIASRNCLRDSRVPRGDSRPEAQGLIDNGIQHWNSREILGQDMVAECLGTAWENLRHFGL